jgi:nitroreductase
MEGLLEAIDKRRANRAFSEERVPEEIVARIMTASTFAPSCFNNQSWRFVVVTEDGPLKKVRDALSGGNYWMKKAPVIVIVATKPELGCQLYDRRDYALFDCGLAVENLILQAVHEGLYAHAIAGYDPLKVKQAFSIPDDFIVITLVAIGYPGDDGYLNEKHSELEHSSRSRKPASEVIGYNTWDFDEDSG